MTRLGQDGESNLAAVSVRPPGAGHARLHQSGRGHWSRSGLQVSRPYALVAYSILAAPDLFLTYMNADTVRLTTNKAGARHLNSVHGVYLNDEHRDLARELLPLASLNSVTLLSAELCGRSYGGGILKMEPKEADRWWMPSPDLLRKHRTALVEIRPRVQALLQAKNLLKAVSLIDELLLSDIESLTEIRSDRQDWAQRRTARGKSGGKRSEER